MSTIYVAHDQFGQILSVVREEGDLPVAGPGVNVSKFEVVGERENAGVGELARLFHVDVRANQLVEGPLQI